MFSDKIILFSATNEWPILNKIVENLNKWRENYKLDHNLLQAETANNDDGHLVWFRKNNILTKGLLSPTRMC